MRTHSAWSCEKLPVALGVVALALAGDLATRGLD
jgi:hypothetical protein